MAETDDIRQRIDRAYASLRPAERAVARLVHGDPMSAGRLTVGQLADAAHVSQPTVIRFAARWPASDSTRGTSRTGFRRRPSPARRGSSRTWGEPSTDGPSGGRAPCWPPPGSRTSTAWRIP